MIQTSCIIGTCRETEAATCFSVSHLMCRVSNTHWWLPTMSSMIAAAAVFRLHLSYDMMDAHGDTGAPGNIQATSK